MAGGARSRESHRRRAVEKRQARRCWRDRRSPGKSAHLVRELVGVTLVDGLGGEEEGASVLGGHLRGLRRGNASEGVERESARFRSAEKAASGKARSISKRRRSTRRLARRRRRATATDARSRASRGRRTLCDEAKCGVWKVEVVRESGARGRATRAFHRDRRRCRRSKRRALGALLAPQRGCADEGGSKRQVSVLPFR